MTDIDAQNEAFTAAQQACRKAKQSKSTVDLETARLVMVRPETLALPKALLDDLHWA